MLEPDVYGLSASIQRFSSSRDTRIDYDRGFHDGREGKPAVTDDDLSPYEWELVKRYSNELDRLRATSYEKISILQKSLAEKTQRRNERYDSIRDDLDSEEERRINELSQTTGPGSLNMLRLDRQATDANRDYQNLRRRLEREPELHFTARFASTGMFRWLTLYVVFLVVLAVAEYQINFTVFETVLQLGTISTTLVSILFGLLIIGLAHYCGTLARQARVRWQRGDKVQVLLGIPLIIVLVTVLLFNIGLARQELGLADAVADGIGNVASGIGSIFGQGAGQIAEGVGDIASGFIGSQTEPAGVAAPVFLGLNIFGLLLFLINLGVFLVGTLLAFFRHDPHPDFEKLLNDHKTSNETITRLEREYSESVRKIRDEFNLRRDSLIDDADDLARDIERLDVERASFERRLESDTERVIGIALRRVTAYQEGNRAGRGSLPPPPRFGQETMVRARSYLLREEPVHWPPRPNEPSLRPITSAAE